MYATIENGLRDRFFSYPEVKGDLARLEKEVLEGRISAYRAARQLLDHLNETKPE
jgi:hypothetical protein